MSQSRLYVELDRELALELSEPIEQAFEEDGYAIATFEVDIETNQWCVSAYINENELGSAKARFEKLVIAYDPNLIVGVEKLEKTNWVAETLRDLSPVKAGRFIVHGSHDKTAPTAHETAICIDASLAFGTGHHGTTAGCLDVLGDVLKRKTILNAADLGTGTGVLAIAVAKSTTAKIVATDIDPVAVAVASENAILNGEGSRIMFAVADGLNHNLIRSTQPYDLVIANILARPLQRMSRDMAGTIAKGGTLILSGLLPNHRAKILSTYRQFGFKHVKSHIRDEWLTLELSKG